MPAQQAKRSTDIQAAGERVALRPLRREEIAKMEPLLGGAAPAAGGRRLAIALLGEDEPIGVIHFRTDYPAAGWLTIDFVAVAPERQGRGYGAEAVRLLEEEAQRRGLAQRFLAPVSLDNGLAFYFWLRLGYRPARPGEVDWPGPPPRDIIAMVRTAEE